MSSKSDREHFEEYRAQTLAKHTIIEKYIYAYFNILKGQGGDNLVYIDGFAGRGTYDGPNGPVSGSPLRALEKIASHPGLAKKVTTIFIEKDKKLYDQLVRSLKDFHSKHPEIREPQWGNGEFSEVMTQQLDSLEKADARIAPAFVFVDPCGVDGVDFNVIARVLKSQAKAEVFLFFNIEGVRRILGLKDKMGPTLAKLLGSEARAKELLARVEACSSPDEREQAIMMFYEDLLRTQTPAKYVVSFRVEKEDRRVTSHYLIHAAQHPLGFAIMKDVMWGVGKTAEGKGGLALEQASSVPMKMLFTPEWESIRQSILAELKSGMKRVSYFAVELVQRSDNRLCSKAYKAALLELEKEGKIVVINKNGVGVASKRPMKNGVMTLADEYYLKLP
ncbi:three-Cys-motif partner protein TcmP [Sorangium sp. So ce406]|uniref:three-Cys-motif partner protein TcmP n=1 Tax=Sorangium sp. So ce406 TaxID=3133311 RepID=UPI003F5BC433